MEETATLVGIDKAIILLYMVGVLALGSFFGRYVKSAGDFFVAGKTLPFWAIGMSVVVSDIGATDFIATSGAGYAYGVAAANFDWIGSMPAMCFAAFIFIPYYWRAGVFTIPEFLGKRYNVAVQMIHATIWGVFLLVMLAVMLWLTAETLETILGWDPYWCVWLIVALTGIYTLSGGLSAVVMTDVVQLVVMFVGGGALLLISLNSVGGWGELKETVLARDPDVVVSFNFEREGAPEDYDAEEAAKSFDGIPFIEKSLNDAGIPFQQVIHATPNQSSEAAFAITIDDGENNDIDLLVNTRNKIQESLAAATEDRAAVEGSLRNYPMYFTLLLPHNSPTPYPWTGIVFGLGIVMATGYMAGNQAVVQRTLGARSEWDAKGGMLFAGFLKVFIPLLVILPGLCAVALLPPMQNGDQAVPTMIREFLPPGLRGLMFAALFAALMSSVDSYLNSATTIWTTDLYGRCHKMMTGHNLTEKTTLVLGRCITAVFIIAAGFFAPTLAGEETMYNFIQTALSMFQGPVFAILLLGIMWRKTTQWGGLAGLILGVTFTTILNRAEGVFPSDDPFLFVAWWSFVFTVIVTVVVSLITPQDPDEKVRGLVFGQVMHDGEMQRVLRDRAEEA